MQDYEKGDDQNSRKFELAFNMDKKYLDSQALFKDYDITSQLYQRSIPQYKFTDERTVEERVFDQVKAYEHGVYKFLVKKNCARDRLQREVLELKTSYKRKYVPVGEFATTSTQSIPQLFPQLTRTPLSILASRQRAIRQRPPALD
ncbi:hypothetical protein SS50377_22561 [Spironucleus salmonicida]|uniref:Uncharacterized protein n=1 Tax=Spironucleus salmonicida TaxID=348837 RepID=V6LBW5_9EUKA|nr:hypothetical protein SS50377_22561 [Spironucleus salmonicida]|eukprot:EST41947.1 Hypothetical protein SS50377_18251 [Spironucleus salmonicida]